MAKSLHNDVLDALLDAVVDFGDRLTLCSAEPTTYTHAASGSGSGGYMLADDDLTVGDGNDYTISASPSGRQFTVASQPAFSVSNTGDATHVAIVDVSEQKLLAVTTCTTLTLTAGGLIITPAWSMVVNQPT